MAAVASLRSNLLHTGRRVLHRKGSSRNTYPSATVAAASSISWYTFPLPEIWTETTSPAAAAAAASSSPYPEILAAPPSYHEYTTTESSSSYSSFTRFSCCDLPDPFTFDMAEVHRHPLHNRAPASAASAGAICPTPSPLTWQELFAAALVGFGGGIVVTPSPSPRRRLPFAAASALSGSFGVGMMAAGCLGSETDRAEHQNVCYVQGEGGKSAFGIEHGLSCTPYDEFQKVVVVRSFTPFGFWTSSFQVKGRAGYPALVETMSTQLPNPVVLFKLLYKEIRKMGKFCEPLLDKVLVGLKEVGKWVLEVVKEEILARAKQIIVTWMVAVVTYFLGSEIIGSNAQLDELKDLKRELVAVLADHNRDLANVLSDHQVRISNLERAQHHLPEQLSKGTEVKVAEAGELPEGKKVAEAGELPEGRKVAEAAELPEGKKVAEAAELPEGKKVAEAGELPEGKAGSEVKK